MIEIRRTPKIVKPSLGRPAHILLVEDSPSDVAMIVSALGEGRVANDMHVVGDGEAAMAFLRREEPYADLKILPVVVLTTSSADLDVVRVYQLHVNSFVTKPVGFGDFLLAIRCIGDFRLSLGRLPSGRRG